MGSHSLSHSSPVRKKTTKNGSLDVKHDGKRRVGVRARELCEQAGGLGLSLFHSLSHCSPITVSVDVKHMKEEGWVSELRSCEQQEGGPELSFSIPFFARP